MRIIGFVEELNYDRPYEDCGKALVLFASQVIIHRLRLFQVFDRRGKTYYSGWDYTGRVCSSSYNFNIFDRNVRGISFLEYIIEEKSKKFPYWMIKGVPLLGGKSR